MNDEMLTAFDCTNCGDEFKVLTAALQQGDGDPQWCSTACRKDDPEEEGDVR